MPEQVLHEIFELTNGMTEQFTGRLMIRNNLAQFTGRRQNSKAALWLADKLSRWLKALMTNSGGRGSVRVKKHLEFVDLGANSLYCPAILKSLSK